jgi:hypothetical protein
VGVIPRGSGYRDGQVAGEILVSSLLKDLTESTGDLRFDAGRQVELKEISGSQRVFAAEWE